MDIKVKQINDNLQIHMKSIFAFLIFILNVVLVQSIQAAEAVSLQAAFNGEQSFFGVAVTRDVENNPNDYTPLSQEESYFIFCLLNSLYGHEVSEADFSREIERIQTKKARKYSFLREQKRERIRIESSREAEHKLITNPFLSKMIPRLNKSKLFTASFVLNESHLPVLQKIVAIMLLADNSIKLFEEVDKMLDGSELTDESLRAAAIALFDMLNFLNASPKKVPQAKKSLKRFLLLRTVPIH